jgi:hypothetical protein
MILQSEADRLDSLAGFHEALQTSVRTCIQSHRQRLLGQPAPTYCSEEERCGKDEWRTPRRRGAALP